LVAIRRKSHAFSDGGLQWVRTENDHISYIRESKKEKLLVVVARSKQEIEFGSLTARAKVLYGPTISGSAINFPTAGVGIYKLR